MKTTHSQPERRSGLSAARTAAALAAGYVLLRASLELYRLAPQSGQLLGKFSSKWALGYGVFVLGLLVLIITGAALMANGPAARRWIDRSLAWRQRYGWAAGLLALAAGVLPPLLLTYTPLGDLWGGAHLRLVVLLLSSAVIAFARSDDPHRPLTFPGLLFGLVTAGSLYILFERLSTVTDYPFSLTWSEGNRLFDFSLRVDPGRYLVDPQAVQYRGAPGRNFLWGLPFLLRSTPIWLHRLWDMLLWTLPYLAFGYAVARRNRITGLAGATLALWVFVFLFQGPVYSPLILSALLVTLCVRGKHLIAALAATALAGYYAAASRWTWLPAPAGWAALLLLLADFELRPSERLESLARRLAPVAAAVAAGLVGGLLANARLFSPQALRTSTTFSQPLLWYRLLPNINYAEGILLGLSIATLPVIVLLLWAALTRRWPVGWLQGAASLGAGLIFLGGGLVASVKIGGGNNLHNLDMFLITLALLAGIALQCSRQHPVSGWPTWARITLAVACLLPAWNAARLGKPLLLPDRAEAQAAIETIATRAARAQRRGEVLFIDQRQLLTFGAVRDIRLVPEYEKRFLMDKAMAADHDYFKIFYRDLAAGRFALIITEPLYLNEQNQTFGFQEENNAWVEWVARPLLCFYAPVETLNEVRTQLLTPRKDPQNCAVYLSD